MAYRTIFLYSSQNYELLLNIIKKIINPSESKTQKSLRSKNKIIISILKTLIPKKITENSSINNYTDFNSLNNDNIPNISINLIEEIEYETKFNRTNESKIIISNNLEKFLQNLKINEQLMNKINETEKKEIELKSQINQNNNNIELIEEKNNNKKKLYLPNVDKNKYKYTLFIELDETLVHYYEDGNNYFVKVRCGTEDFIKTMSEFCEIIIVSTSNKEYTDIIIKNLNKDKCYVNQTIYKEMFDDNNEILDFSLINRDMSKCIFICHEDEFFNAPKNNIVKLKEFLGEANDREIIYLHLELMKLSVNNADNVTNIIKDIIQFIKNKREEK
jgi:TFIIF-interacting CTD phosphatase-like protein